MISISEKMGRKKEGYYPSMFVKTDGEIEIEFLK